MISRQTRSLSRMFSAVPNTISTPLSSVSVVDSVSVAATFFTCPASSVVMPSTMASALFTLASEPVGAHLGARAVGHVGDVQHLGRVLVHLRAGPLAGLGILVGDGHEPHASEAMAHGCTDSAFSVARPPPP